MGKSPMAEWKIIETAHAPKIMQKSCDLFLKGKFEIITFPEQEE